MTIPNIWSFDYSSNGHGYCRVFGPTEFSGILALNPGAAWIRFEEKPGRMPRCPSAAWTGHADLGPSRSDVNPRSKPVEEP